MNEPMNLVELIKVFGDESKCRRYIEHLRWSREIYLPTLQ